MSELGVTRTALADLVLAVGGVHVAVGKLMVALMQTRLAIAADRLGDEAARDKYDEACRIALSDVDSRLDRAWNDLTELMERLGERADA